MKDKFVPRSEKTRQGIIEKTAVLFNKKGFAGTTLTDLTEATKLTKGSIYGNFLNKEEVAMEVFRHNFKELATRIIAFVSKESTSVARLYAFTRFYRRDFDFMKYMGGCPLMNTATDADDTNEAMRAEVAKAFEMVIGNIKKIIEEGIQNKEILPHVDPEKYGALFFTLMEGGILLSKTTNNKQYLYVACDRIDKIIEDELKG